MPTIRTRTSQRPEGLEERFRRGDRVVVASPYSSRRGEIHIILRGLQPHRYSPVGPWTWGYSVEGDYFYHPADSTIELATEENVNKARIPNFVDHRFLAAPSGFSQFEKQCSQLQKEKYA